MNRYKNSGVAIGLVCFGLGLCTALPARAASLTMVPRSTWGATGVPSYMQMYIYVPDKLAAKPPIYISCHSCGSTATGQISNIPLAQAAADQYGFILLLPDNPGQNCWDVGTTMSLTHNGGGDTQGLAEMVEYALTKYNADPTRVYIMGGSGGAMMTQAMLAVYPELFAAGAARAGVAAGCWSSGYDSSNQWSNNCAAGSVDMTAQAWGNLVRNMYPGYTGRRPRLQMYQGDADTTISYKNMGEAIKEWTNVLNLPTTPTSTQNGYKGAEATWNIQRWANACGYNVLEAWTAPGAGHSMGYEEAEMLKFFGLNQAVGGPDPEPACAPGADGGVTATGGSGGAVGTGTGGAVGTGGSAGHAGTGGSAGTSGGTGTGGVVGSGGSLGSGGTGAKGGNSGSGGAVGTGGVVGTGGAVGSGGSSAEGGQSGTGTGGAQGSGGAVGSGGSTETGSGGSGPMQNDTSSSGCSCAVGSAGQRSGSMVTTLLLAALGLIVRRRQGRPRRPSR